MEDEIIYEAIIMRDEDLAPSAAKTKKEVSSLDRCTICNVIVTRKYMKDHINKHTRVYPYLCLECGKYFNDRPNFSRHMNIHYNTKVYQCLTCPYKSNQSSNLKTHIKTCKGSTT